MNIILNLQQEQFIASQLQTGQYQNVQQVIDEALALLAERKHQVKQQKLAELRQVIAVGTEQIAQGKVRDGEAVFEELQAQLNLSLDR